MGTCEGGWAPGAPAVAKAYRAAALAPPASADEGGRRALGHFASRGFPGESME